MPLPASRKVLQTKWVYDVNKHGSGNVIRFKARLVAKNRSRTPGVDFQDVFSSVPKYAAV